jgi:hypothetical protein
MKQFSYPNVDKIVSKMTSNIHKRYVDLRHHFYDLKNEIRQICIHFISSNRLKENNCIETENSIIFE